MKQAPTLVSAAVNGTSLVLTYSESLATPGPAASAFSVSGATTAAQTPSSRKWRDGHAHAGDHCRIRANDHGQLRRAGQQTGSATRLETMRRRSRRRL